MFSEAQHIFSVAEWVVIIDTDSYSGNFEREMSAYCTGLYGEYVDDYYANQFRIERAISGDDDAPFDNIIAYIINDHEASESCAICPTPGWFNNGVGGHFKDGDDEEAREHYIQNCMKESNNNSGVHPDNQSSHKKYYLNRAEEAKTRPVSRCPAFQSVAIFFDEKPTKDQIDIIIGQALKFKEVFEKYRDYNKDQGPNITGVRLIHVELIQKETFAWKR